MARVGGRLPRVAVSFTPVVCCTKDLALNLRVLISPFSSRFKVFADYEEYIKCQDKVSELYKVRGLGLGAGRVLTLDGMKENGASPLAE